MAKIDLTEATHAQLVALAKKFNERSVDRALAGIIDRMHNAYVGGDGKVPDGWRLNEDLALEDFEAYFDHFNAETPNSAWAERGRSIRAAHAAGWLIAPDGVDAPRAIARLRPATATALKHAIDGHYMKLSTGGDDPNL